VFFTSDDALALCAFRLNQPRIDSINTDLPRPKLLGERKSNGIESSLGAGVNGRSRNTHGRVDGADVHDGSALCSDERYSLFDGKQKTEDVEVIVAMKVFGGDLVDGKKVVDASIVHQDVDFAECLFDLGKSSRNFFGLGEVALNGYGFTAYSSDLSNNSIGIGFAGRIIDDDLCAG
jgi:hypothetical protein